MTGEIALPCNSLPCRVFLLLAWMLAFALVPSTATTDSRILSGQEYQQVLRQLEDVTVEVEEEDSTPEGGDVSMNFPINVPMVDNNNDGIAYNPCSLCQGLTLQADKIAWPQKLGNATCGEINQGLEYQPFLFETSYDSCRGTYFFNTLFESCCKPSVPYYECEQNVHNYISEQPYNTAVPPIVGFEPEERLNVTFDMTYQTLEAIEVEEGTATLFVTIFLKWKDVRLAWDVDDNDTCANLVTIWTGHEVEKAGIWIPDFQLANEIEGIQAMPEFKAHVYADGTVLWGFSGGLKAFCAFRDLAKVPFDTLGCQLLFSAGTRDHSQLIRYQIGNPDYLAFGPFDITYNEWTVVPELGKQGQAYENTVIYYNVYFKRATQHYIQNIVIPTVILTYLSFFTFLLDMRVGERLGFGMALALVVVAQQIVTSGMTPISDQKLWMDKFVAYSFYWVLVGVIESVLIAFLHYVREDKESKKEKATEEELEPLTMEAGDTTEAADNMETMKIEEVKPAGNTLETSDEVSIAKKDNCVKALWKAFVYKMPLRRLDILSLAASVVTYTLYVMVMISTGSVGDTWLRNEPVWFDESTEAASLEQVYANGDPENR